MKVVPEEVVMAFLRRWNAIGSCRRLVPGGLWFGRVNDDAPSPYASLSVKSEDTSYFSDGREIATFSVEVSVWADSEASVSGMVKSSAISIALSAAFDHQHAAMRMHRSGKQTILLVRPTPGELQLDESLRDAQDVCATRLSWRIKIEGR